MKFNKEVEKQVQHLLKEGVENPEHKELALKIAEIFNKKDLSVCIAAMGIVVAQIVSVVNKQYEV